MADLTQPVKTALARYWFQVIGGASAGQSTAQIFESIRARAADLGLSSVGVPATAISTLRGFAGRMLGASRALNAAQDSALLESKHIAEAPWSRSLNAQAAMPVYNISFNHTIQLDDGSIVDKYQTITVSGALPGSVGDLRIFVSGEAQLLAAEGGAADSGTPRGTSLGTSDLMITAV